MQHSAGSSRRKRSLHESETAQQTCAPCTLPLSRPPIRNSCTMRDSFACKFRRASQRLQFAAARKCFSLFTFANSILILTPLAVALTNIKTEALPQNFVINSHMSTGTNTSAMSSTRDDDQKPEVRFINNGKFGKFVIDKCPIVQEKFSPAWWAPTSFMQTLVPMYVRSRQDTMRYTREMINCPDGGVVSLDWFEAAPNTGDTPIAVLFPGLIGDSQSDYLRYIVPALKRLGYRVVTFNNRGRGGLDLRTPRIYCASNFEDLELVLDIIREKNPNSLIVASGFSMGGMVLTRYLAERGANAKVDAAMLISANYDLVNGTKNMETGCFNRFVAKVMTKELVNVLLSDKEVLAKTDKPVQWDKLKDATSFRELDRYFTCPMWGYSDPEDYFKDATNNDRLPKIQVPTLALNSADDMFSPYATLPLDKLNEAVVFVVTQRGGHLGFMDRYNCPFYGDRLIEQYHKAILEINKPREFLRS